MEETIKGRLAALQADYETGQGELIALEQRSVELRRQLLRLSGAIQVLQELTATDPIPLVEASA